ncbi:MAG TPA: helix-turn-helix transcriptional regulator [Geobacteraceae bacterium]|nr:helix-turn-helix transcriptional regulator [Geobacteraceae bacterium]
MISCREIGEAIRRRRKELGISQEQLAEALEVSYQQVQRYENGANRLNVENLQIIAQVLSLPAASFLSAGQADRIAEPPAPYAEISAEEKALLRYFRAIKGKKGKVLVIEVARLAAGKGTTRKQ